MEEICRLKYEMENKEVVNNFIRRHNLEIEQQLEKGHRFKVERRDE